MKHKKKKLLILQNEISSYNVSTYNEISKVFDITVGYYTKDKSAKECLFAKKPFCVKKIGSFIIIPELHNYCKQFDVVCFVPDFHVFSYCMLPFRHHKFKVVSWSIGFRCSYTHPYLPNRKHNILDWLFKCLLSRCDSNIFYMEKSKEFWRNTSLRIDNIFIAPNTTEVEQIVFDPLKKQDFLFVGTLYKGKGLDLLLDSYKTFKLKTGSSTRLIIVGAGEMEQELKDYVNKNNLVEDVVFVGAIYDEKLLARYFQNSLLCFSPTQAGLSVPKSMGYGVPFITRKDAITGGEIYHISHNENGIMYADNSELVTIMEDAFFHRDKYLMMGEKARSYYLKCATIKHMANGAINAFDYALNSK